MVGPLSRGEALDWAVGRLVPLGECGACEWHGGLAGLCQRINGWRPQVHN